jgi:hypothetical protein
MMTLGNMRENGVRSLATTSWRALVPPSGVAGRDGVS